jgi:hypothetical protein
MILENQGKSLPVLANVLALSIGGVWALWLTDTSFSISAVVGFISIFSVAVMDGLLLVSYFNAMRAAGLPFLREAITERAGDRVRPMMKTASDPATVVEAGGGRLYSANRSCHEHTHKLTRALRRFAAPAASSGSISRTLSIIGKQSGHARTTRVAATLWRPG